MDGTTMTATAVEAALREAIDEFARSAALSMRMAGVLEAMAADLGTASTGAWSGPAHDAFERALDHLRGAVAGASVLVDHVRAEAIQATRVLGAHVG
jgi:hypothetical protein